MHWLRTHPFALLFAGAGMLLLFILIGLNATTLPTSSFNGSVVAISGGNSLQDPGISPRYDYTAGTQNTPREAPGAGTAAGAPNVPISSTPAAGTKPPSQQSALNPTPDTVEPTTGMTIFNEMTGGASSQTGSSNLNSLIQEVYALVPTSYAMLGNKPIVRTGEQQALYAYGNQAGLAVLTFSNKHSNMADVLTVWIEDRDNAAAGESAKAIANDMIAVGNALSSLSNVPPAATALNAALAQSYKTAGNELIKVIDAGDGSENAFVSSMQAYNATVEEYTRNYLAVMDLFVENEVVFSSTDMGSAFSFSAAGSL